MPCVFNWLRPVQRSAVSTVSPKLSIWNYGIIPNFSLCLTMVQYKDYARVLQPSARSLGQLPDVQFYSSSTFYIKKRSVISVTPQLFGRRWSAPITHRIGWWTYNWPGRGGEMKYRHPCWDMSLDIWACSSYPMHYTEGGHHNMEQPACLVKAVRRLPLREVGFPSKAYTTSIVKHRLHTERNGLSFRWR